MHPLSAQEIQLLVIVGTGLALIISNRLRPDLVALLVLLALGLSGILPPEQALAGFSRSAVIAIVGLFVITATLERNGVVQWLADRLARLGGTSELRIVAVFTIAGAILSLGMNNIAAGAVLLPAAVSVARRAKVPTSRVLMPLGYGTLLGGMATLFTTANIVASGALRSQNQRALTMLDFLVTGGPILIAGTLYILLIGRRLLPRRESVGHEAVAIDDLAETYQLAERLWEVRVQPESPLVLQTLSESVIGSRLGLSVIGIWHGSEARIPPAPADLIAPNDILLVLGREERVRQLAAEGVLIGRNSSPRDRRLSLPVQLTEVVMAPRSPAIGHTLKSLRFRTKYGLTTVALWREGRSYRTDVGDFVLQAGDALLMVGPREAIRSLADEPGYIVLDQRHSAPQVNPAKTRLTVLITAAVLLLSAIGVVQTAEAMLTGAALLVLTGCINMEESYQAIEWRVVVLIAGMLPIGTALVATGLADQIGAFFSTTMASAGPLGLIASLYVASVVLTQFVGGQVTALIMAPIAVGAAVNLGISAPAVAVAVAIGCSTAFATPLAHPVNVLMMGPGGYTFRDFVRVGAGLTLVCLVTLLLVMPLFWQL